MADQDRGRLERLRYGRARLTVARSGPLDAGDGLSDALDAYEAGEARPASVARAYLRARVVEHSPSFSWRNAKPSELIPLVTSVSADPKLVATSANELAEELVRARTGEEPAAEPVPEGPLPAAPVSALEEEGLEEADAEAAVVPARARARPSSTVYWRRRGAALGALVAAAFATWAVIALVGGDAEEEADEYRAAAGPAARAVADEMDGVYAAFDVYLGGAGSGVLARSIAEAHDAIAARSPDLGAPADDPFAGEDEEARAAQRAIAAGADYVVATQRFLDQIERFPGLDRAQAEALAPVLYEETIALGAQADALEHRIASLGTGPGDDKAEHFRPQPPEDLFRR